MNSVNKAYWRTREAPVRGGRSPAGLNLAANDIMPVRLVSGPPALPALPVARRRPTTP